ncbi:hypothetical protein RhiirA5_376549 [Rhizophagus irregularis]|uniref:Uncharacterized protein n=1 Tax=Rhizophagus irregularis TaxID=588596 RepID=A0A2N0PMK4_9GLOM|nr:hypothetical protein RhiirA5_376549 [Rhizophagus irregularis]
MEVIIGLLKNKLECVNEESDKKRLEQKVIMNPKPLVTNNNNNKQQYCNGCENNFPSNFQFKIREIGVNIIYNTNNLKFELYIVHAEVDGIGVPLAYLFIENNGNCGNGV